MRTLNTNLPVINSSPKEEFCFNFRENFLQIDVFYKELSYEKIEQQKAFEFSSLLSEVGGFLGLLLGASIITMFEILDYLIISFAYDKEQAGPA